MYENNRVVWSEGMFVKPQHFQQHDRYLERLVNGRCEGLRAYGWGFGALQIDQGELTRGKLAFLAGRGVFQDGTPFNMPDDDGLPLSLDIPDGTKDSLVYLALPERRTRLPEIEHPARPDPLARYAEGECEVYDYISGAEGSYPVRIGRLRPRLMLAGQERAGHFCLGVARVREVLSNRAVVLDESFIPPTLNCAAVGNLGRYLAELHGLLHTRGEALAGRAVDPERGGAPELADFLLLQAVNRYEPLFEHLGHSAALHPEEFYRLGVQLAGELATFYRPGKRPASFPKYNHDDLQAAFDVLMRELRQLLAMAIDPNAVRISLNKQEYGIYITPNRAEYIPLLEKADFILAVKASVPAETLLSQFPDVTKIGPVEDVHQLSRSAVSGISLRVLPVAPRQLPYHAGFSYFELNKQSELWKKMAVSGSFAIYVGKTFPGLELQLWAIKGGMAP